MRQTVLLIKKLIRYKAVTLRIYSQAIYTFEPMCYPHIAITI